MTFSEVLKKQNSRTSLFLKELKSMGECAILSWVCVCLTNSNYRSDMVIIINFIHCSISLKLYET